MSKAVAVNKEDEAVSRISPSFLKKLKDFGLYLDKCKLLR